MKIAILSDIHDNIWNLKAALKFIQEQQVETLIFCGDLCSPFILDLLADADIHGLKAIHIVFGNNDGDLFRITNKANKLNNIYLHGEFFDSKGMDFYGKRIAVNHYPDIAQSLADSKKYDLVCYGHNHVHSIKKLENTLLINPGTIMGYDPLTRETIPATFVIYTPGLNELTSYQILQTEQGTKRVTLFPD